MYSLESKFTRVYIIVLTCGSKDRNFGRVTFCPANVSARDGITLFLTEPYIEEAVEEVIQ